MARESLGLLEQLVEEETAHLQLPMFSPQQVKRAFMRLALLQ